MSDLLLPATALPGLLAEGAALAAALVALAEGL